MKKYKEFLRIAKFLNTELNITPVLYGSLGLAIVVQKNLRPKDIDILIPKRYITKDWKKFQNALHKIRYKLTNEKEHEFVYLNNVIGISFEEDLLFFANINYKKLKIISDNGAKYKILNINQYKKIYKRSQKDSYRINKNKKDANKIRIIDEHIKNNNHIAQHRVSEE